MKIKDKLKPKTPPVEPGVYMAVCIGVIDIGEQYSEKYKEYSKKVIFVWALPTETTEINGKTEEKQLRREFSFATKKNSIIRTFLSGWNSTNYTDEEYGELELFDQIGKACQINVVLNDTGEYANVDSVMPLPKGFPAPVSKTAQIRWDMDAWDDQVFDTLPSWAQEKIKKSTQYQKEHAPETSVEVKVDSGTGEVCPI